MIPHKHYLPTSNLWDAKLGSMDKLNVLIIGGGGREHALAWKLGQSPRINKLFVAPGNGGTKQVAENVAVNVMDSRALVAFAKANSIGLTIVTPDDPLAAGVVDAFQTAGLKAFGPVKAAAQIEASKAFSKQLMQENKIPTAAFASFTDETAAINHLKNCSYPTVVKASGLALGKGVIICQNADQAKEAVHLMMSGGAFGEAGSEIVIEDYLEGQEVSIHAISDGKDYILFPTAQDHKPIFDGDQGPNTGGMGTFAPVPWVTEEQLQAIKATTVEPALAGLAAQDSPFKGCLYPGLKMTADGPKVLEYNARFGDPETQSYMRLLDSDLLDLLEASVSGQIRESSVKWMDKFAVCIVLASGGYPGEYKKGQPIEGLEEAAKLEDIVIFHAGTKYEDDIYKTNGGRVLNVTATGETLQAALDKGYAAVKLIRFEGMQYRTDIGKKALKTV